MTPQPDYSDLVAVSDIAKRIGIEPTRVSVWLMRYADVPKPVMIAGGRKLFSWRAFSAFARRHKFMAAEAGHIYDDQGFDVTGQYKVAQ